jgi:hypothetical protein
MIQESEYSAFKSILDNGITCRFCETKLEFNDVDMYYHDGGIQVPDKDLKQWVYVQCSNKKCQYQWSWKKIINQWNNKVIRRVS